MIIDLPPMCTLVFSCTPLKKVESPKKNGVEKKIPAGKRVIATKKAGEEAAAKKKPGVKAENAETKKSVTKTTTRKRVTVKKAEQEKQNNK